MSKSLQRVTDQHGYFKAFLGFIVKHRVITGLVIAAIAIIVTALLFHMPSLLDLGKVWTLGSIGLIAFTIGFVVAWIFRKVVEKKEPDSQEVQLNVKAPDATPDKKDCAAQSVSMTHLVETTASQLFAAERMCDIVESLSVDTRLSGDGKRALIEAAGQTFQLALNDSKLSLEAFSAELSHEETKKQVVLAELARVQKAYEKQRKIVCQLIGVSNGNRVEEGMQLAYLHDVYRRFQEFLRVRLALIVAQVNYDAAPADEGKRILFERAEMLYKDAEVLYLQERDKFQKNFAHP